MTMFKKTMQRSSALLLVFFLFIGIQAAYAWLTRADSAVKAARLETNHLALSDSTVTFSFNKSYPDTNYGASGKPGWARAGDMDNDGDVDIVVGGGRGLFIYKNNGSAGGWQRYGNLDSTNEMGSNGAVLYDVDKDGNLDVVTAQYYSNLGWWENPGGALSNDAWTFHVFRSESYYLHDIIVVDLDKDGKVEEFVTVLNKDYWSADSKLMWFRPGANPTELWESHVIETGRRETAHGHSGLDVGDIDKDGHLDVGFSNGWYEAPDNPTSSPWIWRQVSDVYGISNTLLEDMNGDNRLDLVMSGGHHGQGVFWYENDGSPKSGAWKRHNITPVSGDITQRHVYSASAPDHVHHPECLGLEDMDGDGDTDVVTCDLYFGEDPGEPGWNEEKANVYIFENKGGSLAWTKHNIVPNSYPSHLLQLVDINNDGKLDIIGEGSGNGNVNYFENRSSGAGAPPTNTPIPPTATSVPPTKTSVPVTETSVPPTKTPTGPTNTPSPTKTPGGPTDTPSPTAQPGKPTITPQPTITVGVTSTPGGPTNTPHPPSSTSTPVNYTNFVYISFIVGGK